MNPAAFAFEDQSLTEARSAAVRRGLRVHQHDPGRSLQDAMSMPDDTPRIGMQKMQNRTDKHSHNATGNARGPGTPGSLLLQKPLATQIRPRGRFMGSSTPRSCEKIAWQLMDLLDMTEQDRMLLKAVIPSKKDQSSPSPSSNGHTSTHKKAADHLADCQLIVAGIEDHYLAYELQGQHDERRQMSDLAARELDLWNISGA